MPTPCPDPRTAYSRPQAAPRPYRHTAHLDDTPPAGGRVRAAVAAVLFVILALAVLGFTGSADYRTACAEVLAAGASDAADAVQCAEDFPELNR